MQSAAPEGAFGRLQHALRTGVLQASKIAGRADALIARTARKRPRFDTFGDEV